MKNAAVTTSTKKVSQPKTDTAILQSPPVAARKKYLLELPNDDIPKLTENKQGEPRKIPNELVQRENTLLASVLVPQREVTVLIYDNGIVDNDIVSVFVDSNKIFNGVQLSEKAITFTLIFSETISQHQIVTVAENLGDIFPNTGLLVIKAGNKMIEIPIMSDFKKNAKIVINYKANCNIAVDRYN
ncbi:MAG: hypothetical protein FGM61_08615 [Sediminibacterium sp.]|nr:hypothetical protein [Sediminibacterium sp.]